MSKEEFKKIRESFFETIFVLLGKIANCDGYINRDELKRTRSYMERMQLSDHCKNEAIRLFRTGANPQFNIEKTLERFKISVAKSPSVIEVLLVYLISVARVDGLLVEKEYKLVKKIAATLGYSSLILDHMLRMITAQEKFSTAKEKPYSRPDNQFNEKTSSVNITSLEHAHQALGLKVGASATDVKKAYRKLINQYHPDKVQGQGLPPEFINAANDYFKRLQAAFELINKHRNLNTEPI